MENNKDLYILYKGHPHYNDINIIEDDFIRLIIQKYQMILFTNKGEMYGDPDFGADILKYLFKTKVSGEFVKKEIIKQIEKYIPESINLSYDINVTFDTLTDDFADIMFITFTIADYEINNYF